MRTFDVIVVGGGIIGGAIALRLAQSKLRVAILDRADPGNEASWAAAGMLSPVPDSPSAIPLVPFGRTSLSLYPQFVAEVEEISGHHTGFRQDGAIEVLFSSDAERQLSTLVALHRGLGLPTEPLPIDEARKLEPALGREAAAAAWLPYEGSVCPRPLTSALLEAAKACGVEVISGATVIQIVEENGQCGGVSVNGEMFAAAHVVLAAGAFSAHIQGVKPAIPVRPIRGQMICMSGEVRMHYVLRSERGYVVPRGERKTFQHIVAGSTLEDAGFEKRVTPAGLDRICSAAIELVPALAGAEVIETWSGLRPDTPDHLPLLGPSELPGLTIATGHYRNGILLAPITAKLVGEWITEQRVSMDWQIFSPLRFAEAQFAQGNS